METVIGVEENDEAKFEDSTVAKTISEPSSPKQIAYPVVYKLVRVEGDGRLVPATDDEVMEVEDLLGDVKSDMHFDADTGQTVGCTSNDGFPSGNTLLKDSEALIKSENPEADVEKLNSQLDTEVDLGRSDARLEEIVPPLVKSSNDSHVNQSGNVGECSNPIDGSIESGSSTPAVCTSSKPDFSKLKGEICLDNLSVKELHETFKATFGRETSVKDKQWLKRRIAMGLTNSCDVTTTTFVIIDNKVVKKGKEESCRSVDGTLAEDPVVGAMNGNCGGSPVGDINQIENPLNVSGKRLTNPSLEDDCISEDLNMEQTAAKRVRKPTRRYIEELSEVESREYVGKLISSVKNSGHSQLSSRSHVRPVQNVRSDGRPVVTRRDSLGGSGVQVPYVSRIRRGRPRENFMALMKLQPSGMGMAAKLVKKALGVCGPQLDKERGNSLFKARSDPGWIQQPIDKPYSERKTTELEEDVELKHIDSSGDNSDDNVVTVPTAKGGMRRKHHRPWTPHEVVKLVEGVARYGAGRWSEIKRLAFASYSYRTSVDLKDKWRNLLRASFTQLPAEKGMQDSRKHASMPIPAPILVRVRELAEMQAQVPPNVSSSKFARSSGRSVHETRSGYL
ncbi:hypothetical protein F0562_024187 [Nyssa sinensis]|uniref:Uncharacterized protein n=1 Tax=Nyssa sinensis TaxID=561372 RepID=A0A5J5BCZ9_9ASTE|nr:hypothetical protein F0562_024187 [Nyssa sinensis]